MLKFLATPLLFITMNSQKPAVDKKRWEESDTYINKMKELERKARSTLFIKNIEYQLGYGPIQINYSQSGCFNFNFCKMVLSKTGRDYFMELHIIKALDIEMAEEKYTQKKGDRFIVKLTPAEVENLKNALVEDKKWASTVHNYISIIQGEIEYLLMDNNPTHPIIDFIIEMERRNKKRA